MSTAFRRSLGALALLAHAQLSRPWLVPLP